MMGWIWFALSIAAITFFVETGFLVAMAAKPLRDFDARIPPDLLGVVYFWLVVGVICDVLFNWTRGTYMFREFPKEFLFSTRVQRHYDNAANANWATRRHRVARRWARILNAIDPGHIR